MGSVPSLSSRPTATSRPSLTARPHNLALDEILRLKNLRIFASDLDDFLVIPLMVSNTLTTN